MRPRLLNDPDELRARLARRRSMVVAGPPRAMCVALRASDRRINPATAAMSPWRAADPATPGRHEVVLTTRLAQRICRPLNLTLPMDLDAREFAARLGLTPASLHYLRKKGWLRVAYVKGLEGRHGPPVPLVWAEDLLDPCSGSGFRPADVAWGSLWQWLPDLMPPDFEQVVWREPCFRTRHYPWGDRRCFRGWRWICPGCGRRLRIIYYPLSCMRFTQWLGEEAELLAAAGTNEELDGIEPPPPGFACHRCHRIRFWSAVARSHWNDLIAYMSGGLLYGHEVQRPADLPPTRRRAYRPRTPLHPRQDEVERLLRQGLSYAAIAKEMGVKLSTVQGHIKRLYRRLGVHKRRELNAKGAKHQDRTGSGR